MSTLPLDAIVEILSRLPVSTLLRFRCVSKQFRSIIDGEELKNRHLHHHSSRQKLIFEGVNSEFYLLDLDSVDMPCKLEIPLPDRYYWSPYSFVNCIGSCDGLLAVTNGNDKNFIVLFNASTKKHHILPECALSFASPFAVDGFGLCSGSSDSKFVKIVRFGCKTTACVYSSQSDRWSLIELTIVTC